MARDMRVRWAIEEAGQPYDVRLVSMKALKKPARRARSPFGSIPTYEEGDLTLFESGAILLHIAERYEGLLPKDANARARAITWMFAALNTVEPPVMEQGAAWVFEKDKIWQGEHLAMIDEQIRSRLGDLSKCLDDADWIDGAAPDGMAVGASPEPAELKRWRLDRIARAGARLMGRVTFEGMASFWLKSKDEYAAPMNDIPKVVFSKSLDRAAWPTTTIARGDLAEEIVIFTRPIAYGGGKPLFHELGIALELKLLGATIYESGTKLHFFEPT